jgi:3,4-dihydroxy 2-butanone 4-phosphate synthase
MAGHAEADATTDPETETDTDPVDRTLAAFRRGDPVLVHDAADREGETDLVYPASDVDAAAVARMRNDAGGLVCVALSDAVSEELGLPFVQETIDHGLAADHDLAYDERSSFSLTVNHRETFTGITDADRALTISELGALAAAPDYDRFVDAFRAPGHVHLLRAAPDLLDDRKGHTELGVALAHAADREPAVVVCEMLDDETGGALSPTDARAYARRHGLVYVEGAALVDRLN